MIFTVLLFLSFTTISNAGIGDYQGSCDEGGIHRDMTQALFDHVTETQGVEFYSHTSLDENLERKVKEYFDTYAFVSEADEISIVHYNQGGSDLVRLVMWKGECTYNVMVLTEGFWTELLEDFKGDGA